MHLHTVPSEILYPTPFHLSQATLPHTGLRLLSTPPPSQCPFSFLLLGPPLLVLPFPPFQHETVFTKLLSIKKSLTMTRSNNPGWLILLVFVFFFKIPTIACSAIPLSFRLFHDHTFFHLLRIYQG